MFNKVNEFIRDYDGTRYLVLFSPEKYGVIFDRIRYLKELKSGIKYVNSFNYAKIKIDSDDDLPLEKALTLHNDVMIIMPVFNKSNNQYDYKTFSEKWFLPIAIDSKIF